jgi:virulence-associated protein VapD
MEVAKLKEHYGEPYNKAYDEIRAMMEDLGFIGTQSSLYLSKNEKNDLTTVYKVINKLSNVQWFSDSVRDIRAFKVSLLNQLCKFSHKYLKFYPQILSKNEPWLHSNFGWA